MSDLLVDDISDVSSSSVGAIRSEILDLIFSICSSSNLPSFNLFLNGFGLISFIFNCGKPWMFWLLKHKPTNKIVGTVHIVPNVFGEKDSKGRYKTASFQHGVIDKKYQRKGLMLYLYGMGSLKATDRKSGNNIKYGLGTVASENKSSIAWVTNLGGKIYGRNVILEYKL